MITFGFTLQLDRASVDEVWFDQFTETVFPHAPDCTPFCRDGVAYLGFDREAKSLREAVLSAVEIVRRADRSVTVVGVALDDGQSLDALLGPAGVPAGK